MTLVSLRDATERAQFGGKAAQLAHALRAGLPVPDGWALAWDAPPSVSAVGAAASSALFAVRSSAVDEDGARASFAGQHMSVLGVRVEGIIDAIGRVRASAAGGRAYREKLGLTGDARMGVVVQRMVAARVAGVLFTRHPTTHADELVIESAWGLGESVVNGLVVPDSYRVSFDARVLEERIGVKDTALELTDGGTRERAVDEGEARAATLDARMLAQLADLARDVARVFPEPGEAHDIEWAFDAEGSLSLLQRRAITR